MSVIYKISCKDLNIKECYFGSTKNFNKRKIIHKSHCYKENIKEYVMVPKSDGSGGYDKVLAKDL